VSPPLASRLVALGLTGIVLLATAVAAGDALSAVIGDPGLSWLATGIVASCGVAVLTTAVAALVRPSPGPGAWADWELALRPLSMENGTVPRRDATGFALDVHLNGAEYRLRLEPEGDVAVRSPAAARQGIVFLPRGAPPPAEQAGWREVGGGPRWVCRAEVPVSAHALLELPLLNHLLDRFFARPEAKLALHDMEGIQVLSGAVPVDILDGRIRESLEIADRLRTCNR
jgi:hypothetical protein